LIGEINSYKIVHLRKFNALFIHLTTFRAFDDLLSHLRLNTAPFYGSQRVGGGNPSNTGTPPSAENNSFSPKEEPRMRSLVLAICRLLGILNNELIRHR
jgi:hypothetical protein